MCGASRQRPAVLERLLRSEASIKLGSEPRRVWGTFPVENQAQEPGWDELGFLELQRRSRHGATGQEGLGLGADWAGLAAGCRRDCGCVLGQGPAEGPKQRGVFKNSSCCEEVDLGHQSGSEAQRVQQPAGQPGGRHPGSRAPRGWVRVTGGGSRVVSRVTKAGKIQEGWLVKGQWTWDSRAQEESTAGESADTPPGRGPLAKSLRERAGTAGLQRGRRSPAS